MEQDPVSVPLNSENKVLSELPSLMKELVIESKNTPEEEHYEYLIKFRSQHLQFRIPELESLCKLFGVELSYSKADAQSVSSSNADQQSPFLRFNVSSEAALMKIAQRSVAIGTFYKLLAVGKDYDEIFSILKSTPKEALKQYYDGTPFRFEVESFGKRNTRQYITQTIQNFSFLPLWESCPVSITEPNRIFVVWEDVGRPAKTKDEFRHPKRIFFGVKIEDGNAGLIDKFDVKKRAYIGTTSMDSELALLVANQALANSTSLIFDPFVGTGSLLLTCAHFGALTIGADIDGRIIRGEGKQSNVVSNFEQYHLLDKLVCLIVGDNAHPAWRHGVLFDAIVADPPYGVREGARKIGVKPKAIRRAQKANQPLPDSFPSSHVPSCIAYPVPEVLRDLLEFAAMRLCIGGRLVYWLPTTADYKDSDLPLHPCLKLVANSEQPLAIRYQRRLITMEKFRDYDVALVQNLSPECFGQINPSHERIASAWMSDPKRTR